MAVLRYFALLENSRFRPDAAQERPALPQCDTDEPVILLLIVMPVINTGLQSEDSKPDGVADWIVVLHVPEAIFPIVNTSVKTTAIAVSRLLHRNGAELVY